MKTIDRETTRDERLAKLAPGGLLPDAGGLKPAEDDAWRCCDW